MIVNSDKVARYASALTLFAPNPRARGAHRPATSVRGATHIQVVSRATRDQADPLAPAGRRFGNFVANARRRKTSSVGVAFLFFIH